MKWVEWADSSPTIDQALLILLRMQRGMTFEEARDASMHDLKRLRAYRT